MRSAPLFALSFSLVALLRGPGAAFTDSRPESEFSEASEEKLLTQLLDEVARGESIYSALADSLGKLLAAPEDLEEVLRLEIEGIAAVAEELLLEGDAELAATLLEDAIAMLSSGSAE